MTSHVDDWESHWATFGDAARGNPANLFRMRLVARVLGRLGRGDRLVDIGCGEGDLLAGMHRRFPEADLLGVDISHEGIARARAAVPDAHYLQADLVAGTDLGDYRGWATHGVCSEVLEHLDDPARFLGSALELLRPGSPVIVTVPAGPRSAFDRSIGHRRHYDTARLRALLEEAGLDVLTVRRAGFPFFTLYRLTVIVRGRRLITDARATSSADLTGTARAALAAFRLLLRLNVPSFPFGWQLVAIARVPGGQV